jgi:hypothetical protein
MYVWPLIPQPYSCVAHDQEPCVHDLGYGSLALDIAGLALAFLFSNSLILYNW